MEVPATASPDAAASDSFDYEVSNSTPVPLSADGTVGSVAPHPSVITGEEILTTDPVLPEATAISCSIGNPKVAPATAETFKGQISAPTAERPAVSNIAAAPKLHDDQAQAVKNPADYTSEQAMPFETTAILLKSVVIAQFTKSLPLDLTPAVSPAVLAANQTITSQIHSQQSHSGQNSAGQNNPQPGNAAGQAVSPSPSASSTSVETASKADKQFGNPDPDAQALPVTVASTTLLTVPNSQSSTTASSDVVPQAATPIPHEPNPSSTLSMEHPIVPAAAPVVQSARLLDAAAASEMHIGLRTQAFGNVDIHTQVRESQVGLAIGSERGDLRSMLAPEVAGLQTSLRQQDLRFENIQYLTHSMAGGSSSNAGSHNRSFNQAHEPVLTGNSGDSIRDAVDGADILIAAPGLNVHA